MGGLGFDLKIYNIDIVEKEDGSLVWFQIWKEGKLSHYGIACRSGEVYKFMQCAGMDSVVNLLSSRLRDALSDTTKPFSCTVGAIRNLAKLPPSRFYEYIPRSIR